MINEGGQFLNISQRYQNPLQLVKLVLLGLDITINTTKIAIDTSPSSHHFPCSLTIFFSNF